jgi:hypothetical protein
MRPAGMPPMVISMKQTGLALFSVYKCMKIKRAEKEEE